MHHSRSLSSNSSSSPSSRLSSINKMMMNNNNKPKASSSAFQSKKFDVEQFKSTEFSTTLFIDNITKGLVEEQASRGDDFDATAFKKLLDDNLEFLQDFATETDSDIQGLVEQCVAAEKTFQMQMTDLSQTFETNFSKFSKLDARINRVGSSAARIGDRLEVVDVQQSRAVEAVGCIKYFLELNNADSKRSQVFTDPNKVHELAHLIKKLSGVAQELDLQSLNKGKEATEIISNNIEIELLGQFDKAGAAKDYSKMKESLIINNEFANTLVEFNGGDSCIQRYISTRDMFFKEECIAKDQSMAIDTSKRRDAGDFLVDTRLDGFFKDIIDAVEQEDELIAKIFPAPPPVMSHLIQRIFEQRVRTFMELMLTLDQDNHSLYLRTLCLALEKTKDILVQSLKKYSSFGVDFGTLVNSVFCNYQDEYIEKEVAFLVDSFQHTLNEIRSTEPVEAEDREKARVSVLSTVTTFLSTTEEAVARAKVLSPDDQPAQNVQRIFKSCLIKFLGYDYLDDLLNRACRLPSPTDPKFLLGLQNFFTLVATITSAVLLIQRHFQLVTQPLVSASVNEYTQCYEALGEFMAGLETKISNGMSIAMQSLGACMEKLLAEQKKDDFKFKDEATEYSNDPTKVCQTCVKFIHNVYDTIIDALDGRNVEIFLEEFGLKIQKMLLAHFKKFKIGKGGLKLMRDLSEYKDALKMFQIPAVDEACEVLGEISKLHLIAPENLKTVIEEGVLSRMDISEVLEFVKLRNDYKSTWIGKYV